MNARNFSNDDSNLLNLMKIRGFTYNCRVLYEVYIIIFVQFILLTIDILFVFDRNNKNQPFSI